MGNFMSPRNRLVFPVLLLLSFTIASALTPQTLATQGLYGFQVGVGESVTDTGAAVDIKIVQQISPADGSTLAFWVGIDLPNDAFFQVGYLSCCNEQIPNSFWTYFPPGKASEGVNGVSRGVAFLTVNSWVHFSLVGSGDVWTAYVNNSPVESVNLGISHGTDAYAIAEDASASSAKNIIHPVEFRDLQYRDSSGWHSVSPGVAISGYGAGSSLYSGQYPYGIQTTAGVNNDWMAGSGLPTAREGQNLWPWYRITISTNSVTTSSWYVDGDRINLPTPQTVILLTDNTRNLFEGWFVNGVLDSQDTFTAVGNMTFSPVYAKQYLVQVNSSLGSATGSGWYNEGANATISVQPSTMPAPGILGELGVRSVLTGWTGDYNGSVVNSESTIQVKTPMVITAVWKTGYGFLPYYVAVIIAGLVLAIQLIQKRKKKQN